VFITVPQGRAASAGNVIEFGGEGGTASGRGQTTAALIACVAGGKSFSPLPQVQPKLPRMQCLQSNTDSLERRETPDVTYAHDFTRGE